jgi:hypothetical protein
MLKWAPKNLATRSIAELSARKFRAAPYSLLHAADLKAGLI